ncbi:uncharacterized protein RSE6_08024 [Rhynchosporium secalis]|uniref:Uncharacterized protein n=1 Tax=Rhynchosporium secalis TaxID=38038 RepID=A0A1E1MED4_RHYSE|nr:uncharacterized protein RSE6_08024 [Rhynchosporium secalis]
MGFYYDAKSAIDIGMAIILEVERSIPVEYKSQWYLVRLHCSDALRQPKTDYLVLAAHADPKIEDKEDGPNMFHLWYKSDLLMQTSDTGPKKQEK